MKNTLFQNPNEENNNYETTLNDLISTKNELAKTTYNLNQREKDYNKLMHQFQTVEPKLREVSETNEKLRKELNLQIQENKNLKNDNNKLQGKVELNEKYKNDFCSIKGNIESLYKNKIEREIQENYEYKVKQKEIEIKNLENKYKICEKEKNSLKYELDKLKNEKEKEIYNLTNKYENEKNILNKKIEEMICKAADNLPAVFFLFQLWGTGRKPRSMYTLHASQAHVSDEINARSYPTSLRIRMTCVISGLERPHPWLCFSMAIQCTRASLSSFRCTSNQALPVATFLPAAFSTKHIRFERSSGREAKYMFHACIPSK